MKNLNSEDSIPSDDPLPSEDALNSEDLLPNNAGINNKKQVLKAHLKWEEKVVSRENDGEAVKTYWKSKSRTTAL